MRLHTLDQTLRYILPSVYHYYFMESGAMKNAIFSKTSSQTKKMKLPSRNNMYNNKEKTICLEIELGQFQFIKSRKAFSN